MPDPTGRGGRDEGAAPPEAPPEEEPRAAGEEEATAGPSVVLAAGDWRQSVLVPLLAVITALALGGIVIVFSDPEVLPRWASFFRAPGDALAASGRAVADSYAALFRGALGSPSAISETLVTTAPLIFAGLSVAVGFRAGLFNIGAEGQITVGALLGSMAGFSFPGLPGPVHLTLMVGGAFIGGAIWGAIPGILKAKTGAHEVITTIMMNFIAANLALFAISSDFYRQAHRTDPISKPVEAAFPHLFGEDLRVHVGIIIALAVAAGVAWLLNRTTVGFEFKAVGANPDASRASGMSPTRVTVAAMALAGGLAGLAAANNLGSVTPSVTPGFSSGLGFDAIALALLGRARPSGVVAASLLFGVLRSGSRAMQAATRTPIDIIVVIQALVIAFVAAPALIRAIYRIRARRVAGPEAFAKGWGG